MFVDTEGLEEATEEKSNHQKSKESIKSEEDPAIVKKMKRIKAE
jgi:hypothetical protein